MKAALLIMAVLLSTIVDVAADQVRSWNLSRAMINHVSIINKSSTQPWQFLQSTILHSPIDYTLLPLYSSTCINGDGSEITGLKCWQTDDTGTNAIIGVPTRTYKWRNLFRLTRGVPHLHPGFDRSVIIRWTSPVTGGISIHGRVASIHRGCGDGIDWFVDHENKTLLSGSLKAAGDVVSVDGVPMIKGESIYFIIDRKSNHGCDTSNLDVIITSVSQ